jgi:predicted acetylornithine/succinylornithine family transaminase
MNVLTGTPLLPTYARFPITFVDGDGCWLIADDGQRYLDLVAGIAVVSLGHCHPAPLEAAREQLERLWHVSNLYSTEPMEHLAERLSDRFGGAHAFFCNSGTEAVEAAIKWARKATEKTELVALEGSFHVRTMGALSITGQPSKRAPFEPLIPGVRFATPETLADAVGPDTAAIVLEPVQGEGGVRPLEGSTLEEARALADEFGAMLVFDEVQTGVGRTGEFFAWQRSGVRPDAVTLAKGLANGLPIGALLVGDGAPTAFVPGDHASTFGGNPVSCAAAVATITLLKDRLIANAAGVGAHLMAALKALQDKHPLIGDVRGRGLMIGVELVRDRKTKERATDERDAVVNAAFDRGLLLLGAGKNSIRFSPPLVLTKEQADTAARIFDEALTETEKALTRR